MRRLDIETDDYVGELDIETDDYVGELDIETDDYVGELDIETRDARERLQKAWASGNIHEAYGILVQDIKPWYVRWLLNRFSSISVDDAEECVDAAIESVYNRGHQLVGNVYNYLFTGVRRNAIDLVKERKHFVPIDPEWVEAVSDDRLLVITEAALDEELTVRVDQLRQLYTLTLPKLPPNRRRLAELLLLDGAGSSNEDLAEMMGLSKAALKSLKSRTLSDLRGLLPVSAAALGIDFEQVLRPTPEVWELRPLLPSEDNGEDGE